MTQANQPPPPLMAVVREWTHDRCECGIHGQMSCHAAKQLCPKCKRCQVEAALRAWAEQLEHDTTWWSPAQIMERVLGVEE